MGLFGMSIGGLILLFHLAKIEVLGVPYLSPFVSDGKQQFVDTIFRLPIAFFKKRPNNLETKNQRRQR
jgi:spore germination protein KA